MSQPGYIRIGQRLRTMLFGGDDEAQPESGAPVAQPHQSRTANTLRKAVEGPAFSEQIRGLAHEYGQFAVGRMQILGFQAVQTRLADRWAQLEDKVSTLIEGTLKRRLSGSDVFRRYDSLTYLVIFAELSVEEARVKAQLIAEEVWQQLFGKPEKPEDMEIAILTVDLEKNEIVPAMDMETAMARLLRQNSAVSPSADSRPPAIKPEAGRANEHAPPGAAEAKIDLGENPAGQDEDAEASALKADAAGKSAAARGGQASLTFTPIWMVGRNAVASFYCRLRLTRGGAASYGHDIFGREPSSREIYELDLTTMTRARAAAMRLSDTRARVMLILPVHYTSLVNREARRAFIERCASLARPTTQRIIIELVGLGEGFPPHMALELKHLLSPHCKEIWAQVPPVLAAVSNLREAGFAAIGFDARHVGSAARMSRIADRFVEAARKCGMRSYVQNLILPDMVATGMTAGFDYMSGDAVHRPFDTVPPPFRLSPDDLPTCLPPADYSFDGLEWDTPIRD